MSADESKPVVVGEKRPRETPTPKTFLIRHKKVRSEFALKSWMLYDHRDALGIASWFEVKETLASKQAAEAVDPQPELPGEAGASPPTPAEVPDKEGGGDAQAHAQTVTHDTIGVLKPGAPVQCVYVDFSRKPYFLLEWCRVDGDGGVVDQPPPEVLHSLEESVLRLNGVVYKGDQIEVLPALPGVTVASQRNKVIAVHKAAPPAALVPSAGPDRVGGKASSTAAPAPAAAPVRAAAPKMVPRALRKK